MIGQALAQALGLLLLPASFGFVALWLMAWGVAEWVGL